LTQIYKTGQHLIIGKLGDKWIDSTFTAGRTIDATGTLINPTPNGTYYVKVWTNCDNYDETYEVKNNQEFKIKKITTNFFETTNIKIWVTCSKGNEGKWKLMINYSLL
tara:strand:+ start:1028 stop:1351 length:324 start_codon:yes stop_codon:yes gene_type:complete